MHGFCHIEIPTIDAKKSAAFYKKIFDWEINEGDPNYLQFTTPDKEGGGFATTSKPTTDGIILYIQVEDIEKKLTEIENAGGKTVKGKTGISPEYGFFGLFSDPSGNLLGVWSRT